MVASIHFFYFGYISDKNILATKYSLTKYDNYILKKGNSKKKKKGIKFSSKFKPF